MDNGYLSYDEIQDEEDIVILFSEREGLREIRAELEQENQRLQDKVEALEAEISIIKREWPNEQFEWHQAEMIEAGLWEEEEEDE